MADTVTTVAVNPTPAPARNAIDIIVASAKEAIVSAILVWALGGVALSLAAGFAEGMIPSAPPGWTGQGSHAGNKHTAWHVEQGRVFALFVIIFFAHSLWLGFRDGPKDRKLRMLDYLRANWFSLIVGNAITAWVAALLLNIIPNFSFAQMLWHWVWAIATPFLQEAERFIFGPSTSSAWSDWFTWYQSNQSKLYFWIIFLGGAFDDLGAPNFKTLARWAWRRLQTNGLEPKPRE